MVNLYGLYVAVVLLWRFRLQVVPLSLGTSYSLSASCVTSQKNFTQARSYGHDQRTNRKRQYSLSRENDRTERHFLLTLSKSDSTLCKAKAMCGATLPSVIALALFYESVNRLTETKEIEKKNKTKQNKKKTRQQKQIEQKN